MGKGLVVLQGGESPVFIVVKVALVKDVRVGASFACNRREATAFVFNWLIHIINYHHFLFAAKSTASSRKSN